MGLVVLLGFIFLFCGISSFLGTCVLFKLAKDQGKSLFKILGVIGLIVSVSMVAIGAYVVFDFLRYVGVL